MSIILSLTLLSQSPEVAAMERYRDCVVGKAQTLALLDENAEAIARASQSACEEERKEMRKEARRGLPPELLKQSAKNMDGYERQVRQKASLAVMEARSGA